MKHKDINIPSDFRKFSWDKAKMFYYIAHMENFTKASKLLNISQPALSRTILELENFLGYMLFVRTNKGLIPTRKGEELLEIIGDTFTRLSDFTKKDKPSLNRNDPRTLRIGIERGYEYKIVPLISAYQNIHSSLEFHIVENIYDKELEILDLDMSIQSYLLVGIRIGTLYWYDNVIINDNNNSIGKFELKKTLYIVTSDHLKEDEELLELSKFLTVGEKND